MKTITKTELIEKLNAIKGTTFISLDMVTAPRMRKTGNPYMGATKTVSLSGAFNFDYENSVNNQLEREGKEANFESQGRAWGQREGNLIEHKGVHYVQLKVQGSSEPVFRYEGKEISKDVLEPFLQESHKPHTQESLEKEVVVRDVKLDNIKAIRVAGEELLVV